MTRCRTCDVWVEATKCPGNSADARVFVHQDHLPATTQTFEYLTNNNADCDANPGDPCCDIENPPDPNCWTIDPSDPRVCLPKGANVYTYDASDLDNDWDCNDCNANAEPCDPAPPPISGGNQCVYWHPVLGITVCRVDCDYGTRSDLHWATVCEDHTAFAEQANLPSTILYLDPRTFNAPYTFKWSGICWTVSVGAPGSYTACICNPIGGGIGILYCNEEALVPEGGIAVQRNQATPYNGCEECTHGVLQELCEGDQELPGADALAPLYINKQVVDAGGLPAGFQWGRYCYVTSTEPSVLVPYGAAIIRPTVERDCETCGMGVPFVVCEGQPAGPRQFWARVEDIQRLTDEIPEIEVITQKIQGRCYTLELYATPQRIPTDPNVIIAAPKCTFTDCEACICSGDLEGICEDIYGVTVRLCPGQSAAGWRGAFVEESAIPGNGVTYFSYLGYCVYVNAGETPRKIQRDSDIIYQIDNITDSCSNCIGNPPPPENPPGGGPGDPPTNPPGPGDPPHPPPHPPGQPPELWYGLIDCCEFPDGPITKWIKLPSDTNCNSVRSGGACYALQRPGRSVPPASAERVTGTCGSTGIDNNPCPQLVEDEGGCSGCTEAPIQWRPVMEVVDEDSCFDLPRSIDGYIPKDALPRLTLFKDSAGRCYITRHPRMDFPGPKVEEPWGVTPPGPIIDIATVIGTYDKFAPACADGLIQCPPDPPVTPPCDCDGTQPDAVVSGSTFPCEAIDGTYEFDFFNVSGIYCNWGWTREEDGGLTLYDMILTYDTTTNKWFISIFENGIPYYMTDEWTSESIVCTDGVLTGTMLAPPEISLMICSTPATVAFG